MAELTPPSPETAVIAVGLLVTLAIYFWSIMKYVLGPIAAKSHGWVLDYECPACDILVHRWLSWRSFIWESEKKKQSNRGERLQIFQLLEDHLEAVHVEQPRLRATDG